MQSANAEPVETVAKIDDLIPALSSHLDEAQEKQVAKDTAASECMETGQHVASEEQDSVKGIPARVADDEAVQLVEAGGDDDDKTAKKRSEDARVLVDMGFKVGEAHGAVRDSTSLDEAANKLLEKDPVLL